MPVLVLLFAICSAAMGQDAMPKTRMAVDPDALLPRLLSADEAVRTAAFRALGMELVADWAPRDVRLFAENLDEDPEPERVLVASTGTHQQALVMKRDREGWWILGEFMCCSVASTVRDPFIELRSLVASAPKYIMMHGGGSVGTGVGEERLYAYRVRAGQLHEVLDVVEAAWNWAGSEQTEIAYEDQVVRVRRRKFKRGQSRDIPLGTTCEVYRWDEGKFAFVGGTLPCRAR